ncbi:hypothetical protein GCM10020218_049990 [Dactylosporangium vinaceum]
MAALYESLQDGNGRCAGAAGEQADRMRWILVIVGVLALLAGGRVDTAGLDVLGGSANERNGMWAVIGPIVAVVGLVLLLRGARRRGYRAGAA